MVENIIKIPGTYDELDVRCPRCHSSDVLIFESINGYYGVIECYNCGYKKSQKL
ncbi:Uncharacterised protein [uncultured archaeon]|nr:Uncharacterised protein [uncultured archaeon]